MRIWTIVAIFLLCYCHIFVGGQLPTSLKGLADKTFQQNDNNNNNQLLPSSFRHERDDGNQSIFQQSFVFIDEGGTRRLDTTQVNFFCFFFHIFELFIS